MTELISLENKLVIDKNLSIEEKAKMFDTLVNQLEPMLKGFSDIQSNVHLGGCPKDVADKRAGSMLAKVMSDSIGDIPKLMVECGIYRCGVRKTPHGDEDYKRVPYASFGFKLMDSLELKQTIKETKNALRLNNIVL